MVIGLNVRILGRCHVMGSPLQNVVWVVIYCPVERWSEIKSSTKSENNSGKLVDASYLATSHSSEVK
jgi:hypothetical protein